MTYDQAAISDLSDFIIRRIQQKFGLWFELTGGGVESSCITYAALRDAASFLYVYVDETPIGNLWTRLPSPDDSSVYVSWKLQPDSRREFSKQDVLRTIETAIKQHSCSTDDVLTGSFEVSGSCSWEQLGDVLSAHLPILRIDRLPKYNGKLVDDPGFQLADPNTHFGQFTLASEMSREQFTSACRGLLRGIDRKLVHGKSLHYSADGELKQSGGNWMKLIVRRY